MLHLRICVSVLAAASACSAVDRACDISVRDQALLITISQTAPAAGAMDVASMAGAEVECAALGTIRVVRYQGRGMYVLDPGRAFDRWGQTGASFSSRPSLALHNYLEMYKRFGRLELWEMFGRGDLTQTERASISITAETEPTWNRLRLLDSTSYRAAVTERASAEEEQTARRLLYEKARWYIHANEPAAVRVLDCSVGDILKNSAHVLVTVLYREQRGAAKKMVLRVPINVTMAPYVGYPIDDETALRSVGGYSRGDTRDPQKSPRPGTKP